MRFLEDAKNLLERLNRARDLTDAEYGLALALERYIRAITN